jgi:hypothetical protein
MKLTRRSFLAGLLSVGATIALVGPLSQATAAQVDNAWKQLLKDPWFFEVNAHGTIVVDDAVEPKIRSDVFDIYPGDHSTPEGFVAEVQSCTPLVSHFQRLAADELEDVQYKLEDDDDLTRAQRQRLERFAKALSDPDEGWADWVVLLGAATLPRFVSEAQDWLESPIEGNDYQWFPIRSGAQGQAMAFFESIDQMTLDDLGVVIIEGEHPGSSYYAAELRQPIDAANDVAEGLELPFRFKAEGTNHA